MDKQDILYRLLQQPEDEQEMLYQWEQASCSEEPIPIDTEHLLQRILDRIHKKDTSRRNYIYYKVYSMVATVLLLLAVGGLYHFSTSKQEQPTYIVTTGIQRMEAVTLPDGTEVMMGPGSKLTYPSSFGKGRRVVELEGQAFFDVSKDPRHPFAVRTSDWEVEALGTSFEVYNYPTENRAEVVLVNGRIRVQPFLVADTDTAARLLSPDEWIVLDRSQGTVAQGKIDAKLYTAWRKQQCLSFEKTPLAMIIPRLEHWYGRHIICTQDLAERYSFTFKVRDESLETVLRLLQLSAPLKVREMGNGDYCLE